MKIEKITKISFINSTYIEDEIGKFISQNKFISRTELGRIIATKKYYQKKIKEHDRIIAECGETESKILNSIESKRIEVSKKLAKLRRDIQ